MTLWRESMLPLQTRGLATGLGFALLLHAALLWFVRMPSPRGFPSARLLPLELAAPMPVHKPAPDAPGRSATRREAGGMAAEAAVPGADSVLKSDAATLMETAREIARAFARQAGPGKTTATEHPILPQLDRALRIEAAGERRVGANVVRISDGKGHAYCLMDPPDWVPDGPIPRHAVQVTCP